MIGYSLSIFQSIGAGGVGAPAAPVNTEPPVIHGDPNGTIGVTTGAWTGVPAPAFSYQWKRNGVNIAGANASTYTPVGADQDTAITVEVTATNSEGSASVESAAVYPQASITADDDTTTVDNDNITVDRD